MASRFAGSLKMAMGDPQVVDIGQLSARDLDPLLVEQALDWNRELDWDFSKSADLVRKFAAAGMLSGAALLDKGEVAAYGFTGLEDHKGLLADLYVRARWRNQQTIELLFGVLMDALMAAPVIRRIETQLMLIEPATAQALGRKYPLRSFERLLMKLDTNSALPPGRESVTRRFRIEPWGDQHLTAAALVMPLAYRGHVDAEMNDHYRSVSGARSCIQNMMEFTGSAAFHGPASYIAFDLVTGAAAGISLSSFVAEEVGHISEICVAPDARGEGLGYELLRHSIGALRGSGAKWVSLTVTAANEEAAGLYVRCGFREARRFYAYVWERSS
jgi:ribosomal protein S18 acetylase RimI-like enzyme